MTINDIQNIFKFIGGIGMFLYGTHVMSENMQVLAGNKLKNIIKFITANKFMGIVFGAIFTILINSSSATTVMIVGFVNAELMTLNQAVGVIMGANIGTTFTAWIVSLSQVGDVVEFLNPIFFAPLIIGIASLINLFSKKSRRKTKASIFIGIGLLFIGLSYMKDGVSSYSTNPIFKDAFLLFGENPFLGIIVGAFVTMILQSSAASVSILQMLALNGAVTKGAAFYITMGQNIGTCFTAILSSSSASKNAKRTALLHLLFNLFGTILFMLIVFVSFKYIKHFLMTPIKSVEISIFHTGFNFANTLMLYPITDFIVAMTKKIIPDNSVDIQKLSLSEKTYSILDERILEQPSVALSTVRKEIIYFAKYTKKNLERAIDLMLNKKDEDLIQDVKSHEREINTTNRVLTGYLVKINNLSLDAKEHFEVEQMISMCSDIERIGDHCENIAENSEQLLKESADFNQKTKEEFKYISDLVINAVDNAINCVELRSRELITKARYIEQQVDDVEERDKKIYTKKISNGECTTIEGIAFLDTIGNLERIADHANNIADYVENELNEIYLI